MGGVVDEVGEVWRVEEVGAAGTRMNLLLQFHARNARAWGAGSASGGVTGNMFNNRSTRLFLAPNQIDFVQCARFEAQSSAISNAGSVLRALKVPIVSFEPRGGKKQNKKDSGQVRA